MGAVFTPETLEIAMVSFEGPDQYSQAGGLGVRAKEMCRAFAAVGFATTLYFVGDPGKPHEEVVDGLRLVRICQAVSAQHPAGVYDGEHAKVEAMWQELPPLLVERSVRPAAAAGRMLAILCEEWQTADFVEIDRPPPAPAGHARPLRHPVERQQPLRLRQHGLARPGTGRDRDHGEPVHEAPDVAARRQPDGDPQRHPGRGAAAGRRRRRRRLIAQAANTPCLTFKIGRFSPDKRWHQSLDAIAELRAHGMPARLLMRGGIEHFGHGVLGHARQLGLQVADWNEPIAGPEDVARSLRETGSTPVVNLRRFLPESVLPAISAASAAVLANSGHEPFGLVGLEAMAAGGVAVVGATGEEYARPYGNAIVVETAEGTELASALGGLVERPELSARLREAARRDAADFAWPEIIDGFLERMRYVAARQHVAA